MLGIVVFVGQNMFCDAKHATKRATDDNWKRDVAGSNKRSFMSIFHIPIYIKQPHNKNRLIFLNNHKFLLHILKIFLNR